MISYAQWCQILKDERLPAVVVDLDAFDRNAAQIGDLTRARGKAMRIATKSLRVPELIARVLARGAPFRGLMCFAAEEAAYLHAQGIDDLLIAYPTVQTSDLRVLRALHDQGARVTLMIDSEEQLRAVASAMSGVARPFALAIDVDASLRLLGGAIHLGVRRSPVARPGCSGC
jgi:D-serine deaminase-like pyridoxal phosphate-dependent protein